MIRHEWHSEISPPVTVEVGEMLRLAAGEDAEPGFPVMSLSDHTQKRTQHLLVWLLSDPRLQAGDDGPSLAAYMRLEWLTGADAGIAEATYVVHPAARSRGITTLLAEQIGPDLGLSNGDPQNPIHTLRIWALGNHPAAFRMALRFSNHGIAIADKRWQLLAPLRGTLPQLPDTVKVGDPTAGDHPMNALWRKAFRSPPLISALPLIVGDHDNPDAVLWIDGQAAEPTEYGPAARLIGPIASNGEACDEDLVVHDLLSAGMRVLLDDGHRVAALAVDPFNHPLVHHARCLGFVHDRTDVQYVVPVGRTQPGVMLDTGKPNEISF
ncbi:MULTISPECIES: hypothetical protein [unclassified Mycolicibacterium]|uniref:hypothetical protein n=1 Tax=unclassified Mycolicibacterium TaxID=2636767 RepID=UPI0012DC8182|nr:MULTISPECIES: hypothetical protein [unclassified Mycolicibacterium]MUL82318.1 hypothetical protein [Mycolicibacterium sp. CBMA 329]MUL88084.1 hypothetical protein [Mycolicibacterium sp. CBMA 331]MUM02414.1 hypothetical protein [Mycolicibacterium sp. CBMA 334]MUM24817.1 hypothetical protein [Mycolicibacterium sp. CBMA 295]MUM38381.1 hypothetical protein [Mycolicibacterium sp. CBMA 247]